MPENHATERTGVYLQDPNPEIVVCEDCGGLARDRGVSLAPHGCSERQARNRAAALNAAAEAEGVNQ